MNLKCSACEKAIDSEQDGIKLWDAWFCSTCFLSQSGALHRELKPEDVALFKTIGRELSGLLPPGIFEMILAGFYKRATGKSDPPPREAVLYTLAELQRLTALHNFQREINLLRTWNDMFTEFTQGRQREIQEMVKRLTDLE